MTPLNPILKQILEQRILMEQVPIRIPPRLRIPPTEVPPIREAPPIRVEVPGVRARIKPIKPIPREQLVKMGVPKTLVPVTSRQLAPSRQVTPIDILIASEKRNPALVKVEEYNNVVKFLTSEIDSTIARLGTKNDQVIWNEVTIKYPQILDTEMTKATVYDIIRARVSSVSSSKPIIDVDYKVITERTPASSSKVATQTSPKTKTAPITVPKTALSQAKEPAKNYDLAALAIATPLTMSDTPSYQPIPANFDPIMQSFLQKEKMGKYSTTYTLA
ncbi:hypothetical protein EBU91_02875 [bacterium]|nr:hypothetical protein [bacterium]